MKDLTEQELLADVSPEIAWQVLSELMPQCIAGFDMMLESGMSPKWIVAHDNGALPEHARTFYERALRHRADLLGITDH